MIEQQRPRITLICDICGKKSRQFQMVANHSIPEHFKLLEYDLKNGYKLSAMVCSDKCAYDWADKLGDAIADLVPTDWIKEFCERLRRGTRITTFTNNAMWQSRQVDLKNTTEPAIATPHKP